MKSLEEKVPSKIAVTPFTQEHLRDALGNNALEGLHPTPEDMADLERIVSGELSGADYLDRIRKRYGVSV